MCGFDSHCELQAYPNRRGKRGSANCTSSHALLSWQSAWNSWDVPRLTLTQKRLPVIRFDCLRLAHVLFCGDQVGCSAVLFAVQLEPVVPYSAAIPQCHSSSPAVGPASISQRGPWDTKCAYQSSGRLALSPVSSNPQAWLVRGPNSAPAPREKATLPSGLSPAHRPV